MCFKSIVKQCVKCTIILRSSSTVMLIMMTLNCVSYSLHEAPVKTTLKCISANKNGCVLYNRSKKT